MIKRILILVLTAAVLAGCGPKKTGKFGVEEMERLAAMEWGVLPPATGGFVLAVGGETITSEQVIDPLIDRLKDAAKQTEYSRFASLAYPSVEQAVKNNISGVLLYRIAVREAGDKLDDALEKAADQEVKKFVTGFGGDYAKAEKEIRQIGMDWKSFKDYQKRMIMSQSYLASKMPKEQPVTYAEVKALYDSMTDKFSTPASVTFSLIDIQSNKCKSDDPNVAQHDTAEKIVKELVERIKNGEDFSELAKQYSHGHRASFGGQWPPLNPDSLAAPYDMLATKLESMQPGEVCEPIEAVGHIFIVQLNDKQFASSKSLEDVQPELEARLRLMRRKEAIDKLSSQIADQANAANMSEFVRFCVEELYIKSQRL
ncbi:MAG: peptidylprolyl isomerase [Phycisphaerae bacterium]|nr:peptidylprolyl isomerase [Phycisphaerae bacterium]